ncbi:MAG: class I SAM-dependent methyltransferase [Fuerstiella sp.]|nr:class I SAM-dependent methyltransferase [Fuerstiella sp.]MCP4511568.1 class I SAM-dependent methyltransferase [Fuerstiella sp.]
MFGRASRYTRQLNSARTLLEQLALKFDNRISVRLWDGTMVPLGKSVDPDLFLSISGPGVIGSLLRKPTPDNLLRHYAHGHLDFHGADIHTFIEAMYVQNSRSRAKKIAKSTLIRSLLPFLLEPASSTVVDNEYQGNVSGRDRQQIENLDFVKFHYDVSNEFYELFLDKEMVYTCGYFTDWDNSLDQAQHDKLDMICRKLQLQPGDRFLDIGFGWGGLLCHAAKHYGVQAHGITLSENQLKYTQEKVRKLGLEDKVTVEICDYAYLEGEFDKVASICMYEHVGIDNMDSFMLKVNSLLTKNGRFLLQGITRPGKENMKKFRKMNADRRLLAKHIFPGAELDHLGHMVQSMESQGFEVADVEGWRNHYIQTCRIWCQRLYDQREQAIKCVGEEKYRMWLLYLVGCSLAFKNGGARLYQVLAEKHARKEKSGMPPTRRHLYEGTAAASNEEPLRVA